MGIKASFFKMLNCHFRQSYFYPPNTSAIAKLNLFITFFAILYLGLKLFIVPFINLKTGKLEIPDINPSDVGLVIVILLFQTELPNLIRKIKIGSEGFEAEYRHFTTSHTFPLIGLFPVNSRITEPWIMKKTRLMI